MRELVVHIALASLFIGGLAVLPRRLELVGKPRSLVKSGFVLCLAAIFIDMFATMMSGRAIATGLADLPTVARDAHAIFLSAGIFCVLAGFALGHRTGVKEAPGAGAGRVNESRTVEVAGDELAEIRSHFQAIAEFTPVAIFISELDGGKILYCNRGAGELQNTPSAQLLGTKVTDLYTHPQDRQRLVETLRETGHIRDFLLEITRRDGVQRWITLSGELVYFEGRPSFLSAIVDVTDRVTLEDQLRTSLASSNAANAAKTRFLSSLSHELRNPLNTIMGYAQLLEMEELAKEQQDGVKTILSASHDLLELISELLDLSAIEAGALVLEKTSFSLTDLLRDCVTLIEPVAAERGIRIVARLGAAENVTVWSDAKRIKQILMNFLSNACKYNVDDGSIFLDVESGDGLKISVTDTGPGIPRDKHGNMFEAFNRLGMENRHIPGTGIGLTICRELAAQLGANVGFTSEEGEGSTFWLSFAELPAGSG